jgi:hypothetical protein
MPGDRHFAVLLYPEHIQFCITERCRSEADLLDGRQPGKAALLLMRESK